MDTETQLTSAQRSILEQLAEEIVRNQPVVAFTGAGISTESGIPDYRGPNGLWNQTKPTLYRDFLRSPEIRARFWERRRERYPVLAAAEPNAGHYALCELQASGYLGQIITQNIDGLHQKAGSDPTSVIELHGSTHQIRCLDCRRVFPAADFAGEFDGPEPVCLVCGGMVKEATISFGESLVADDLRRALTIARSAALMLVVGSSLTVNPAAKIPLEGAKAGATLAIINNQPTSLDDRATYLVASSAGAALSYLRDQILG